MKNIKIFRAAVIVCIVLALSAAAAVCFAMQKGNSTYERENADIVAVPASYFSSVENALFAGEPSTVYFDRKWAELLKEVEGVEATSSQLFLATLNADCCESKSQLIAFDEDSDFVIKQWLNKEKNLTENEVIAGINIGLKEGETVEYYGVEFKVAGILDESGKGYDNSVFVNYDGAKRIIGSETAKNFITVQDDQSASMVNIKVKNGYDVQEVSKAISDKYSEIAVYTEKTCCIEMGMDGSSM